MTIKEVEKQTGMTRANVRFYEQEGLLSPVRSENGYRNYTEADVGSLKKIKLLRTLHMSLEEIREIHDGRRELAASLQLLAEKLEEERETAERFQVICQVMQKDGVCYESLDAQHYLDQMENGAEEAAVLAEDVQLFPFVPWRRFLARRLDFALCSVCWILFLALVCRVNVAKQSVVETVLGTVIAYILMLCLEPLFLSRFGTTPGKWVWGIRVERWDGQRLDFMEAFHRTWAVCSRGMAFSVPVYSQYRLWKKYREYAEGKRLEWEDGSILVLKDCHIWRAAAFAGANILLFGAIAVGVGLSQMPPNRGGLTVAEFCENYNYYAHYYDISTPYFLDAYGDWEQQDAHGVVVDVSGMPRPDFLYTEEGGNLTGLEFTVELEGNEGWISDYSTERALAALAFVKAQDSCHIFSKDIETLMKQMQSASFENSSLEVCGISVETRIVYLGYQDVGHKLLFPDAGQKNYYYIHFSMRKDERVFMSTGIKPSRLAIAIW